MLHAGQRWISLPKAAQMLQVHSKTLARHLDKPDCAGFDVLERVTSNNRRRRYLSMREIRYAMGRGAAESTADGGCLQRAPASRTRRANGRERPDEES